MKFNLLKNIVLSGLAMSILSSCGGTGACETSNDRLSLSLTAPNQYPAGIASTAYLTITNTSNVAANNLYYTIPAYSNTTGTDNITVQNGSYKQPCINIAAHDSCTFPVEIAANSSPGSFKIIATSNGNQTVSGKLKSALSLQDTNSLELTANIGLTTLPTNEQVGANGITFLYSKILPASGNNNTLVDIVAVVNSQFASNCGLAHNLNSLPEECSFNTINLTDKSGNRLDFSVLSANSGTGYTNLANNSIVTFRLTLPKGTTTTSFYAQTMKNGTLISQGTVSNPISLTTTPHGIVEVSPTYFKLSVTDNYTTQTITYTNTGNAEVKDFAIQTPQAPISISDNKCTANLSVGSSCSLKLVYNTQSNTSGSGSLTATYNNTTVVSQYNYTGLNTQSGISISAANNLNFNANTINTSESTQVTLTNTGNVNESNFVFSFNPKYFTLSVGNDVTTCAINSNTVTTTLGAGQSCNFTLNYTNANVSSGTSDITIDYKYQDNDVTKNASASKSATYTTTQATANLNAVPNPKNFGTIVANNSDYKTESFVITNNGSDTATDISFGVPHISSYRIQNNNCLQSLEPGKSCNIVISFGPTATESSTINGYISISYNSATGGSTQTLNLSLSGSARAPLSADMQVSAVSYTGSSGGTGESSATPFQVESSNATTASLVLTYKNFGTTMAESLNVLTESINIPAGYTLLSNGCNNITLATQATCDVILKLATSATGNKNITFSNAILPVSWTDERGQQTNQAVIWNTGTGSTTSSIYVNVYASAFISVTRSESSVYPSESTTFNITLTGGYNVATQTVSIINPNVESITFSQNSCNVSSVNSSCIINATFGISTTPESYTFNISNSGNVTITPSSILVNVMPFSTYAYIINNITNSYTQCNIGVNGIESATCKTITPTNSGALNLPIGIGFNQNYAYITNSGDSSYTQCDVGINGIESVNCKTITLKAPNSLASPYGIAFNANYAYIVNNGNNSYTQCSVGLNGIESATCKTITLQSPSSLSTPYGIAFNTNYAYIINNGNNTYNQCNVGLNGIESATCRTITIQSPNSLNAPTGIAFNGLYAYILNSANSKYNQCNISINGIESAVCQQITPSSPGQINRPAGIAFDNNYVYITNGTGRDNSYTQCNTELGSGRILSNTCNTIRPGGLSQARGIAVYTYQLNSNNIDN